MIAIRLTFPASRYHATPWGRHVNEGVAEWPPSPYRLLRALYDVWKRKCFELAEEDVRGVLEALAEAPPQFLLPAAVAMHTRSYLSSNAKDPTDKNLVFDPFLVLDRANACYLLWPELQASSGWVSTLKALLENLNYLGRSESWIQAELWDGAMEAAFACSAAEVAEAGHELTRVACAASAMEYEGKQPWMEALTFSTSNLLKERASSPPLLRQVRYTMPKNAVMVDPPRRMDRKTDPVDAVLLGLDATVLPLVTTTLEVAEQVRVRLMGAHRKRMNGNGAEVSGLFSGKDADGKKRLDHGHLYILPLGNGVGRIDRILLKNPLRTFTEEELDAVRGVRELYQRDGRPSVACVVTWQGELKCWGETRRSRTVESLTPFVPPRHWRKGREMSKFLEDEARRECRNHGISARLISVEACRLESPFDVIEYRRNRKDDPVMPGFALRLRFETEVATPFAIGYGAHFGLGQFGCASGPVG